MIDQSRLDRDLFKLGIDYMTFSNVIAMTPRVYRSADGEWKVKHEFSILNPANLEEEIDYIFTSTVDIIVSLYTNRASSRQMPLELYKIKLKREGVPVYKKADREAVVVGRSPSGVGWLNTDFKVQGLNDSDWY